MSRPTDLILGVTVSANKKDDPRRAGSDRCMLGSLTSASHSGSISARTTTKARCRSPGSVAPEDPEAWLAKEGSRSHRTIAANEPMNFCRTSPPASNIVDQVPQQTAPRRSINVARFATPGSPAPSSSSSERRSSAQDCTASIDGATLYQHRQTFARWDVATAGG